MDINLNKNNIKEKNLNYLEYNMYDEPKKDISDENDNENIEYNKQDLGYNNENENLSNTNNENNNEENKIKEFNEIQFKLNDKLGESKKSSKKKLFN